MKKVISQISLILLIITIGILSVFATNIYAADSVAGINCPASVKVGENFTVSLILPSGAYGADAKVTVTYSDGTTASKTLTYMSGMADFPNSVTFSAKVAGTTKISVTSINIGNSEGGYIEQGGTKSGSLTIVGDTTSNNSGSGTGSNTGSGSNSGTGSNTGSGSNSSTGSGTGTGTGTGTNSGSNTGSNTGTGSTTGNNGSTSTDNNSGTTTSKEPKFTDVNETVYTTQKCNVRKSYSTDSEKIATVEKDTKFTRKAIGDNGWSKVEYNGQTAYVYSEYLTKTEPEEEEEVVFKDTHENLYAKQNCNLRASWSTDSEKVGYLTKGQAVERTGYADNGWSRIIYNGKTVYVASRLLVVEKPEEDEEENTVANNTVNNIVNNSVRNENIVDDPTQMSEEDRLKELEEDVGVLPEVGTNIANIVYAVVTFIAIAGVIASIIYVKKVR